MEKSIYSREYLRLRQELRAIRNAAGLSQRELAIRLDVPHSWVAKVETGERRIDLVEFAWFCTACEIQPAKVARSLLNGFAASRVGGPGLRRKAR